MSVLPAESRAKAETLVARYPDPRSALLPLLYLVQAEEGHVTRDGMREVAEILGLTTAEVEAVATFYSMFKKQPTGKWLVSVCTNVSCALVGGRELYEKAHTFLGDGSMESPAEGEFTLEEVECLGACDGAPVVQINYCNYFRVSAETILEMIERLKAGDIPEPSQGAKPVDHAATARILSGLGDDRA
jgi:NADH-quinone oxidoreductase subunit E